MRVRQKLGRQSRPCPGDQGVAAHQVDVQSDAALATGILQGQHGIHEIEVQHTAVAGHGEVDEGLRRGGLGHSWTIVAPSDAVDHPGDQIVIELQFLVGTEIGVGRAPGLGEAGQAYGFCGDS